MKLISHNMMKLISHDMMKVVSYLFRKEVENKEQGMYITIGNNESFIHLQILFQYLNSVIVKLFILDNYYNVETLSIYLTGHRSTM